VIVLSCSVCASGAYANIVLSYNRYLAVAARVVRRSLKEDKRLAAERRGEMDLRFAKWEVRDLLAPPCDFLRVRESPCFE
jgi:hypothetical protein